MFMSVPSASPKIHFLLALIFVAVSQILPAQEAAKPKEPDDPAADKIVQDAVQAISDHYLHVQMNPLWNIAEDALLKRQYHNSAEAFQAIQQQLPGLEDSELNLLTPTQVAAIQAEATGQSMGLGLADFCIDLQVGTGRARVVTPLAGSPVMMKGIEPRDVIVTINDKQTSEMNHEQVADALRAAGPGGTRLEIERGEKTLHFTLEASAEKLQPLRYEVKHVVGKSIGYIRVTMFVPDLGTLAHDAVSKLEQSGVDGYVLDLRNNPGGFLNSAKALAGVFMTGSMGFTVDSKKKKEPIEAIGTPLTKKPLAVVVNEGTASASEILSSGLQGSHRAQLVGASTYGRGQAQIFFPIAQGYGLQIPSVLFLTLDGQSYKGKGIAPDIEVKQPQLQENQLTGPLDKQFLRAAQSLTADKH
jgi:carboxyl-terminal processing protease